MQADSISGAIKRHRLPADFEVSVQRFYRPLADALHARMQSRVLSAPVLIGLQGTQGSGKSTAADFLRIILQEEFAQRVLVASIDDFYLTLAQRQKLAQEVHPLLLTRGVPGTHDLELLNDVLWQLKQLQQSKQADSVYVPVFNKAADDRAPRAAWQQLKERPDVVILEGWCVGIPAQPAAELVEPLNELERDEDPDGHWRGYVNQQLRGPYAELWRQLDYQVVLQAPDFDCVFGWRLLQEQKLAERLRASGQHQAIEGLQTPAQLRRFISHYERLTRHALGVMPDQTDFLLRLQADHSLVELVAGAQG